MHGNSDILLIEDNVADAHIVSKALEERCPGSHLIVLSDGSAGSDYLLRRGEFDKVSAPQLVLLDLNLPGKNGREVLEEIKSNPKLRTIPIVIFTSSEAESDIRSCYEAGANAYYSKPSNLEEFMSLIENIYTHWVGKVKLPHSYRLH